MWSHYADNHRGFCIGFDNLHKNMNLNTKPFAASYKTKFTDLNNPEKIINFYIDIFHNYKHLPEAAWQKKYADLAKTMTFENDQLSGISVLTDKYEKWQYEQEFRLIDEKNFGLKKFTPSCIKSITFVLKTNTDEIHKIVDTCKKNQKMHVKFFQTIKAHGEFKLNIKKLDLQFEHNPRLSALLA